jgi:mRNA-degrading endonuclease RelE of RelBE toxin-antitoxin system
MLNMAWVIRTADEAQLFIDQLPEKTYRQISHSINQLEQNPFHGDVKPLKGSRWKGYYRKRVGDYRIIFFPHRDEKILDISYVWLRSEKTYR